MGSFTSEMDSFLSFERCGPVRSNILLKSSLVPAVYGYCSYIWPSLSHRGVRIGILIYHCVSQFILIFIVCQKYGTNFRTGKS
jgi:hypothetical protein